MLIADESVAAALLFGCTRRASVNSTITLPTLNCDAPSTNGHVVALAFVAGRRIYIKAQDNQSVRVCTEANVRGQWAHEFWLDAGRHVTVPEIESFAAVEQLVEWLTGQGARTRFRGEAGVTTSAPRRDTALRVVPETSWIQDAKQAVESSINALVQEFVTHPYLHRVEHSLHVRLVELLAEHEILRSRHRIGRSSHVTQLIHKEWPETRPRPEKKGRGNFDLAILSPNQLDAAEVWQFDGGHIEAAIVIEMGLNYDYSHLHGDHEKLLASDVAHGYLIDFRRRGPRESRSESLIWHPTAPIQTAYAHYDASGQATIKFIGGSGAGVQTKAA